MLKAKKKAEKAAAGNLMYGNSMNPAFANNASGIGPLSNYGMTNAMGPLGEWPDANHWPDRQTKATSL